MQWLSGLGRLATAINKAVLLVQPRLDLPVLASPPSTSFSSPASSHPAAACACVAALGEQLQRFQATQLDLTTFHWNLTPSLANASFSKAHLAAARMEFDR